MDDELRLRLHGAHGEMDARALHVGLGALLDLLDGPEGRGARTPPFVVSQLSEGSMAVALRPRDADRDATTSIERVWGGVEFLVAASGAPAAWDRRMLRRLIALGDVVELPGVEGADLTFSGRDPVRIDGEVRAHAQESLQERRTSIGSVRGRLDRWTHRGEHHEVGLIDEATERPIRLDVPDELSARVLAALQQSVLAWGDIRRNANGDKLRLSLEDFEVIDASVQDPTDDVIGLLGDWTGGEDSVDWVRAQRAE